MVLGLRTKKIFASTLQAYMLVDLFCFLLPFTPNDFLFVGHHIMTATYMMSSVVRAAP